MEGKRVVDSVYAENDKFAYKPGSSDDSTVSIKLDWVQLSEFQGDKGKVNTTYNIMAFPTYFLLDKEGIVLAKSNSLAEIEVAIKAVPELK